MSILKITRTCGRAKAVVVAMFVALGCSATAALTASDQIPGKPQTTPIAVVGAKIVPVEGAAVENGILLFDGGRITAIGQDVPLPEVCEVIDASGKVVYPGLIEAYSDLGLVEINSVRASLDASEIGDLNPNVRAVAAFNPDSEIIPVNRANGILLAVTAPSGRLVAGRSSLMMLDGWTWEDMTLQADTGMHVRWPRGESDVSELNAFFEQSKRYAAARERLEDASQPRDLRLDAMLPVLSGELPIIVDARSSEEITQSVAFAKRHKLRLIIHGGYDAMACAELLVAEKIPVIISSVYRNPPRRHDPYDAGYTLPAELSKAGIQFCISAGGRFGASGLRNLPYNAATAAAYGLSPDEALRSITLWPAEILGVADRVGSLAAGKDATLFIADGDILETPTQVEIAFIQGRRVDLSNKHTQLNAKYRSKYGQTP